MKSFLEKLQRQIKEFFGKLSKKDKVRLGVISVLVVVFAIVLASFLGRTTYAVLYSGLTPAEAGDVIAALEERGVPYQTQGTGTVLVPAEQAVTLQMNLASDGLLSDAPDTSIFGQGSGFGATDQDKNIYYVYQLQQDIRKAINSMERIEDSQVLLTLQQKSSFAVSPNSTPATASISLKVKGGSALNQTEARAIATIVEGAVPGIALADIKIVDSKMNVYNPGSETTVGGVVDVQLALQDQLRSNLETQVVNLLTPVFGPDNVNPSVNVTLNFDKKTVTSVEFAPPVEGETQGLIVSYSQLYEAVSEDGYATGIPGGDTQGLNNPGYPYTEEIGDQYYTHILNEVNNELNETRSQIEEAQGQIESLSIGIILNSAAVTEDYTNQVTELVAMSIGVPENLISVQRLPFQEIQSEYDKAIQAQQEMQNAAERNKIIRTIIIAACVILIVVLILSFLRTLMRGLAENRAQQLALASGPTIDYIAGGEEEENSLYADIDINAKPEGVEQIEKFIDKDPQAVAQLLRNWLSDEGR